MAGDNEPKKEAASAAAGIAYAKLGLAGCLDLPDWPARWLAAIQDFPPGVAAVAVAYADWQAARAPQPREILSHAVRLGCRALLVDTFDKSHGPLPNHWPLTDLADFVMEVQRLGLVTVLGGSLGAAEFPRILPLGPDYLAVRGAVCPASRAARLDPAQVRTLRELISRRA
jgi:dihydroneopterin aldolase